ncbi:universal stress protein Slr1101-like [Ruditapes philippinarum]|uniref:universal stress protein Slr1101-like n=1 Tax=Ruditapes philippinarum TaxID=129788 RepID=UPI00295AFDE5|nr:universal stress protein Slr1101-like [Ruditapes philippinarum]
MAENAVESRTVIIGMDGSEFSQKAFDWYWENLRRESDKVILVYVPEYHTVVLSPLEISAFSTLTNLYAEEEQMTKDYIEKLTSLLKDKHAKGKVKATTGRPGEVIVKTAEDMNADVIITGSRGMGTIRRTILGSVSDYVMHHSSVPVIVCKH